MYVSSSIAWQGYICGLVLAHATPWFSPFDRGMILMVCRPSGYRLTCINAGLILILQVYCILISGFNSVFGTGASPDSPRKADLRASEADRYQGG